MMANLSLTWETPYFNFRIGETYIHYHMSHFGYTEPLTQTACDKVSPAGILIANTDVDDRIKMSKDYYRIHEKSMPGTSARWATLLT